MSLHTVLYETRGPIAVLTLNRPEELNAIDARMVADLGGALDRAVADAEVRAIVLRGAGRAFSAGFDLEMGEGAGVGFLRSELTKDFQIIMRFWDCPKPTVAAVHTYCLGSAMEMAVACDPIAVSLTKQAINRSAEIMGMRQALLQGLELDVVVEASETPESREFNEILAKAGAKAAIAWREARLAKQSESE